MGNPLPALNRMTVTANGPRERADASRYVLRKAHNLEDLRLLLDALGLNTPKEGTDA